MPTPSLNALNLVYVMRLVLWASALKLKYALLFSSVSAARSGLEAEMSGAALSHGPVHSGQTERIVSFPPQRFFHSLHDRKARPSPFPPHIDQKHLQAGVRGPAAHPEPFRKESDVPQITGREIAIQTWTETRAVYPPPAPGSRLC